MLRTYMMERASDATLKDGKVSLNGIGVCIAAHVFVLNVIYDFVSSKVAPNLHVL